MWHVVARMPDKGTRTVHYTPIRQILQVQDSVLPFLPQGAANAEGMQIWHGKRMKNTMEYRKKTLEKCKEKSPTSDDESLKNVVKILCMFVNGTANAYVLSVWKRKTEPGL